MLFNDPPQSWAPPPAPPPAPAAAEADKGARTWYVEPAPG